MRAVQLLIPIVALAASCGPPTQTTDGFVTDVQSSSVTRIDSFTLRTPGGESLTFGVGALDFSPGGFPAGHLREHMVANQAVRVTFIDDGEERSAIRLTDAPWLQP